MNKKKGFTLIELIIGLFILSLLATLVILAITRYMNKGGESYYKALSNQVELGAKDYYSNNQKDLPKDKTSKLELPTLMSSNSLTNKVIDVNGNECTNSYVLVENDEGEYKYHVCLICEGKIVSGEAPYCVLDGNVDLESPTCTINTNGYNYSNWSKAVTLTVEGSDKSGIDKITYNNQELTLNGNNANYIAKTNGENTYTFKLRDKLGNWGECKTENNIKIDLDKPICKGAIYDTTNSIIKIVGEDLKSGVSKITYGTQELTLSNSSAIYDVTKNGDFIFTIHDNVSNTVDCPTVLVRDKDNIAPVIAVSSVTGGINTATINTSITDNMGVVAYAITTSDAKPTTEWTNITSALKITPTFTKNAATTYYIHAKDAGENWSKKAVTLKLTANTKCGCSSYYPTYECGCSTCGGGCKSYKSVCSGGYYTDCFNYCPNDNPDTGCFLKGTVVLTPTGYKNIDKFEVGDKVIAYNVVTKTNEIDEVTKVLAHKHNTDYLYELTINNDIVKVTSAHRFYILNKNNKFVWKVTRDLEIGDKVFDSNGKLYPITKISYHKITDTIYNLEIKNNHNYYVTNNNYLVHNGCKPGFCANYEAEIDPNDLIANPDKYEDDKTVQIACREICRTWVPRTCSDVCTSSYPTYECGCSTCGGGCKTYKTCWLDD